MNRTPNRIEKHNSLWWIMGVPEYQADGEAHYALGGYGTEKEAREAWASLLRSTKGWWPEYARVHDVPATYVPEDPYWHNGRKPGRRRRVVAGLRERASSPAVATTAPAVREVCVVGSPGDVPGQPDPIPGGRLDDLPLRERQEGDVDCQRLLGAGSDVQDLQVQPGRYDLERDEYGLLVYGDEQWDDSGVD